MAELGVLLDTHIALWLATERQRLTFREIEHLEAADSLTVSAVSLWEIRIKWNSFFKSGDRKLPNDPRHVLGSLSRLGVEIIPLDPSHTVVTLDHPLNHPDPFDELLLTQAQLLALRLMTRDQKLLGHPLAYSLP